MRCTPAAIALCLNLLPAALLFAAAPPSTQGSAPASEVAAQNGDAAAKHAKRTACLKDAKARKLVGAAKTTFLKHCLDAS